MLVRAATTVIHGTVSDVDNCVGSDGKNAWTFVQFVVHDTLLGTLIPSSGEQSNRFTVRFKGGYFSDGTQGGLKGTPAFALGDEAVLVMKYKSDGTPYVIPTLTNGNGVFRIFELWDQSTAVVNGRGFLQLEGPLAAPLQGPVLPVARSVWPDATPIDLWEVQTAIEDHRALVTWDGTSAPAGAWQGALRVRVNDSAVITLPEEAPMSVPIDTTCHADLTGTLEEGTLSLDGHCNADYVGALRVHVEGAYDNGVWSGTVTMTPASIGGFGALLTFEEEPWSVATGSPDYFVAQSDSSQLVGQNIPEDLNEYVDGVSPLHSDMNLRAVWTGYREVMDRADLLGWLEDLVAMTSSPGGTAMSIRPSAANCNIVLEAVEAP